MASLLATSRLRRLFRWSAAALLAGALFACNSARNAAAAEQKASVHYYYGEVRTSSPDGKIPYGPPKHSLVKRTIDPGARRIIEVVKQGDRVFTTTLTQTDKAEVFTVTDEGGGFTGTITFSGTPWSWSAWTYDIAMADGSGRIVGSGQLQDRVLSTAKKFLAPDGTEKVLITESLGEITEAEYRAKGD